MRSVREEALKWFEQAVEDLSTAEDLLRIGRYHAAAIWATPYSYGRRAL